MHIPLRELPTRIAELPQDQLIVCYCKSGIRSKRAILFLQEQGFTHVVNLTGGLWGGYKAKNKIFVNEVSCVKVDAPWILWPQQFIFYT
ncbi:hypothetical protein DP187_21305 [Enterobacter cloacae]|nr:hypothetical protein DP187_21305 [Enterobacter cloacae]